MSHYRYALRAICFFVLLLMVQLHARANQEAPLTNSKTGLSTGDSVHVEGVLSSYDSDASNIYRINNSITLGIDPFLAGCLPDSFTCTVGVRIHKWNKSGVYSGYTDTVLKASYNSRTGAGFTELSGWYQTNCFKISAVVTSVSCSESVTGILKLEATMQVEWYPDMHSYLNVSPGGFTVVFNTSPSGASVIRASWTNLFWADEYELEWSYIDNYNVTSPTLSFDNNATRVVIKTNSYDIQNVFEKGIVFFRVRAIGRHKSYPDHRVPCPWTSTQSVTNTTGHDDLKNWQMVGVFAEEGKKKETVSYMDGTMRNRQTATQNNSDSMTIVGETVYDKEGRPALDFMPVPAFSSRLGYFAGFNLAGTTGQPYKEENFDVFASSTCWQRSPDTASVLSGAGKYYSSNNPYSYNWTNDYHAYVPQSGGYPFVQTEYMPDNTGRIRRKSGPGTNHKLGSGHETKYLYQTPEETELIALFGTNVGDVSHYKKNTVIDPNGQASISYLNAKGQVIATSLAGEAPSNVTALGSLTVPDTQDLNLLKVQTAAFGEKTSNFHFEVLTNNSHYSFYYKLPVPKMDTCTGSNCFYGVYDMWLSLVNECGDKVFDIYRKAGQNGDFIDTLCSLGARKIQFYDTTQGLVYTATLESSGYITFTLPAGSYDVNRKVQVSFLAAEQYSKQFIKNNSCLKNQAYFDSLYLAQADTMVCNPTCSSCLAGVGSWGDYSAAYFAGFDTATHIFTAQDTLRARYDYNQKIEDCSYLCALNTGNCETYLQGMMLDVMPGGQYFSTSSVYSDGDSLKIPTPGSGYNVGLESIFKDTDVNLNDDLVMINDWVYHVSELNESQFIMHFDPAWARKLVKKHPEYCSYLKCMEQMDTTAFEWMMLKTQTAKEAEDSGLWNPLNLSGTSFTTSVVDTMMQRSINADLKDTLMDVLGLNDPANSQLLIPGTSTKVSIYKYMFLSSIAPAYWSDTHLNDTFNTRWSNRFVSCGSLTDDVWRNFKLTYFTWRNKMMMEARVSCLDDSSHARMSGKRKHFYIQDSVIAGLDLTGKTPSQMIEKVYVSMNYSSKDVCASYADRWMDQLSGCFSSGEFDTSASIYKELRDSLIAVCQRGTDPSNPFGASSVSTYWQKQNTPVNKNFRDVIKNWRSRYQYGICDETMIDFPLPYGHDYYNDSLPLTPLAIVDTNRIFHLDFCTCNSLRDLKDQFEGGADTCHSANLAQYVNNIYHTTYTQGQIDTLLLACQPTGTTSNETNSWFGGGCELDEDLDSAALAKLFRDQNALAQKQDSVNTKRLLKHQIDSIAQTYVIPISLTCRSQSWWNSTCVPCEKLLQSASDFYHHYGDFDTSEKVLNSLANSLNTQYGFNLPGYVYSDQIHFCDSLLYHGFGYRMKDSTTWGKRPVSQSYLVTKQEKCVCDHMLQLFLQYQDYLKAGIYTKTFKDFVYEQEHVHIGFEPNAESIDSFINRCHGYSDDLVKTKTDSVCFCVTYPSGVRTVRKLDDCVSLTDCFGIVEKEYIYSYDKTTANKLLHFKGRECKKLTSCSEVSNFMNLYPALGKDSLEKLIYAHFGISTKITEVPIDTDCGGRSLRYAQNLPSDEAVDYFSILDELAQLTHLDTNTYINLSTLSTYTTSIYNDFPVYFCTGCPAGSVMSNKLFIKSRNPNPYACLYSGLTFFLGADTNSACKVVFDSVHVCQIDSIKRFFDLVALGLYQSDGSQTFEIKALLLGGDTIVIHGTSYCFAVAGACGGATGGVGCPDKKYDAVLCNEPWWIPMPVDTTSCVDNIKAQALGKAADAYAQYLDSVQTSFKMNYINWAFAQLDSEVFRMRYPIQQYHYTLYYYDQAGNLVQTVPPNGVAKLASYQIATVQKMQKGDTAWVVLEPAHTFKTQYAYNSLNQVIWQKTPDGSESNFWYDQLGRVIASQNAKQLADKHLSYTLYDAFGRINEVGEMDTSGAYIPPIGLPWTYSSFVTAVNAVSRTQITQTYYDQIAIGTGAELSLSVGTGNGRFVQQHLRNRVSVMLTRTSPSSAPRNATFYSYDLHGNVQNLLQYNQAMADVAQEYKQVDYYYDLVSGKVNEVAYQQGQLDAFYHIYGYDADNRIVRVLTSHDSLIWDQDAAYKYYLHGPLARVELLPGRRLQGVDYYYTLQGWIKGVNNAGLAPLNDPGHDGFAVGTHKLWAKDVYGFDLTYYNASGSITADYNPAFNRTSGFGTANYYPYTTQASSGLESQSASLFNGNIRAMVTGIKMLGKPLGFAYTYDQLNRLMGASGFNNLDSTANTWQSSGLLPAWKNTFTYDANGNILTQIRHGSPTTVTMDSLTYQYSGSNNKLQYVTDGVNSSNYSDDIDNQVNANYAYDSIGNLTKDSAEEITSIKWNVYGKITDIIRRSGSTKPDLAFEYGPDGNRILKIVKPKDSNLPWVYTVYVRDAQGNVLAVYDRTTTKKIQYDLISFSDINTKVRADRGASSWRSFMAYDTTHVANYAFKQNYLNYVLTHSLGESMLDAHSFVSYRLSNPTVSLAVWNNTTTMFTNVEKATMMLNYRGRNNYTLDMLSQNCVMFMTSTINASWAAFQASMVANDAALNAAYNAAPPPKPTAAWFCLNATPARLQAIINAMAIGNFNAIITNLQATQMAALMVAQNTFYATVQKDAAMEAFSHSRYLSYMYAQAPTTYGYSSLAYWTAYFTATAPNYYTTMLTSFYLQAGYTQDAHTYYSKEDYLGYIKTYFGTNYYDSLMTYYLTASQHFSEAFTLNEVYIYGSSRIGVVNSAYRLRKRDFDANYNYLTGAYSSVTNMKDTLTTQNYTYKTMERGLKGYELTNHLGNVLAVITDAWYIDTCIEEVGIRYAAHITQATDYSAFGAPLPGRTWYSSKQYRQSFNGKEKDSETELQDYGMRIYNERLGRFLSVDPLAPKYPELTPYQFASNRTIDGIDRDGLEYLTYKVVVNKDGRPISSVVTEDHTRTMTDERIKQVHNMTRDEFYKKYSATFEYRGQGVLYKYYMEGENGQQTYLGDEMLWEQKTFADRNGRHGLYSGPGCITMYGRYGNGLDYDFRQKPIDFADAISKTHDIAYAKYEQDPHAGYKGFYNETRTLDADKQLVESAQWYLDQFNKNKDFVDPVTGMRPSKESIDRTKRMLQVFRDGASWLPLGGMRDGPIIKHKEKLIEKQNNPQKAKKGSDNRATKN